MNKRRVLLPALLALLLVGCSQPKLINFILTPDQQGARAFERGDYQTAAARFEDPMWKGTALYLAERFDEALETFARVNTAEAWFARGNTLAHLERYEEAIAAYERALSLRPAYPEATANIDYMQPFLPLVFEGGVMGTVGRDAAADDIVYDADADRLNEEGRDTEVQEGGLITDAQLTEMWLQQVDASPAAFLRSKFRYQAEQSHE